MVNSESVEKLKPSYKLDINGVKITLKHKCDEKRETHIQYPDVMAESYMKAPENQADNIVNTLNDDCFLEIFSHLDFMSACSVARTCQRLTDLFEESTKKKMQNRKYVSVFENQYEFRLPSTIAQIEDYLHIFGSHLRSVTVRTEQYDNVILPEMIAKYCTNLEEIIIVFNEYPIYSTRTILSKLKIFPQTWNLPPPEARKLTFLRANSVDYNSVIPSQNRIVSVNQNYNRCDVSRTIEYIVRLFMKTGVPVQQVMFDRLISPGPSRIEDVAEGRQYRWHLRDAMEVGELL